MYRRMLRIRRFEETIWDVYTRGLMPGLAHLYIGEEATAVGACLALRDDDYITSNHRGHGHLIAKGGRLDRMMAEVLGKASGYNQGKGGTMHIADLSLGILGANGIVGGGFGIAAGAALSAKLRGEERVALCFFGDGALNQGGLLETANMAALWKLPLIYLCENNGYGEYTPATAATAGRPVARAEALGIPAVTVDGQDVVSVYEATCAAVARARTGEGPSFIESRTYRYRGHHVGDPGTGYRTAEEVEEWRRNDPLRRLVPHLDPAEREAIAAEVEEEIQAALEFGQNAPFPEPDDLFRHVYA
ncbi:MAG: thiamine pyrophosphate-dependent dehydrogenase E1 component subunit alpha [Ardenticatenaceae bacterium]|nr:thiamine pyrophosphate-dependent dehydrogenase E1 component subunit alpha [Ardenticatenaceae bacterium]